jgi:hypothetical protein
LIKLRGFGTNDLVFHLVATAKGKGSSLPDTRKILSDLFHTGSIHPLTILPLLWFCRILPLPPKAMRYTQNKARRSMPFDAAKGLVRILTAY